MLGRAFLLVLAPGSGIQLKLARTSVCSHELKRSGITSYNTSIEMLVLHLALWPRTGGSSGTVYSNLSSPDLKLLTKQLILLLTSFCEVIQIFWLFTRQTSSQQCSIPPCGSCWEGSSAKLASCYLTGMWLPCRCGVWHQVFQNLPYIDGTLPVLVSLLWVQS